jgi:hypothetical protein
MEIVQATAPADTEVHEPQAQAAPTECLAQRDETTSSDDSLLKNPHMGHGDEHVVDAPEQSLDARSVPMSVEPETQASTHETQPHVVPGIEVSNNRHLRSQKTCMRALHVREFTNIRTYTGL